MMMMFIPGGEGGGDSLKGGNGDVPLDGAAFSITTGLTIMGSHFQSGYWNGVSHFRIFGVLKFFIFTVSERTRMLVV